MPIAYYFVLPYTEDEGTQMFLVQRQLIQRLIDGKEEVYGQIPDWAGQWVLVGGKGKEKEPATEAALRLFREQTGIDLSEKQAQTYGVEKRALQELKDKAYNPFTVLFLELSGEGLKKLKSDVRKNINDRTVFDGVLQDADI
ncbi:MAG: NUDIX domain-containing protein, partial [bacterium]